MYRVVDLSSRSRKKLKEEDDNIELWKEATAAMTALVYSILHTRIYRGYVHVY
jgi:hypothetical protein